MTSEQCGMIISVQLHQLIKYFCYDNCFLVISVIIPEGRSRWYAISRLIWRWFSIHWWMHIVRKICSTCWLFSSLRMSFTRCGNRCPLPRTVCVAFLCAKMKVMEDIQYNFLIGSVSGNTGPNGSHSQYFL